MSLLYFPFQYYRTETAQNHMKYFRIDKNPLLCITESYIFGIIRIQNFFFKVSLSFSRFFFKHSMLS